MNWNFSCIHECLLQAAKEQNACLRLILWNEKYMETLPLPAILKLIRTGGSHEQIEGI